MTCKIYNLKLDKGLKSETETRLSINQNFDISEIHNDSVWEYYIDAWERKSRSMHGININNQNYLGEVKVGGVNTYLFYYQVDDIPTLAVVFKKFTRARHQFSANLRTLERMLFGGKDKESTLRFKDHEFVLSELADWHWENYRRSDITIGKVLSTPELLSEFNSYIIAKHHRDAIPPEIARGMFYTGTDEAFAFGSKPPQE